MRWVGGWVGGWEDLPNLLFLYRQCIVLLNEASAGGRPTQAFGFLPPVLCVPPILDGELCFFGEVATREEACWSGWVGGWVE